MKLFKKFISVLLIHLLVFYQIAFYIPVAYAQEVTPTPSPIESPSPSPTENPSPSLTETPAPSLIESSSPSPTEIASPSPSPSLSPTETQTPSQWTFEKVELNKEYVSPQNNEVKLTFTKLPDPAGNIKIEEITLTEDQIKQTGSLSDKAYDITSDMKDGDFTYNLSLPIPESSKGESVEVKFAEELSNIGSAEKVENTLTKTDTSVSVTSLDHFTIFVVVGWNFPDNPDDAIADEGVAMNSIKTISVTGAGGLEFNAAGSTTMSARAEDWDNGYGTKYWEIEFDATAFSSLKLYSKQRSSTTGPRDFKIQYKLGSGGTWTDFGPAGIVVADNWTSGVLSDIAFPAEVNNQPSVFVRWLMNSNIAVSDSLVGSAGASNIDDIRVEGNATTINVPAHYLTIQAAINAASEGDTINVAEGTYNENLDISTPITLQSVGGAGSTIISGTGNVITINADDMTINGFTVTNGSTYGMGVYSIDHSNLTITNNIITNIGNSSADVMGRGVVIVSSASPIDGITISNNQINNITSGMRTGSASVSSSGVSIGWSTGTGNITNLVLDGNIISNINADISDWVDSADLTKGQGAYGILINHASGKNGNTGRTVAPQITNNTISNLEGLWVHAIGLEGNTPNAVLSNNTISDLTDHKTPSDAFAIFFEDNASMTTVSIDGVTYGTTATVAVNVGWNGLGGNPLVSLNGESYIYGVNAFPTITEAVAKVDTDGTVNVAAGTYTEVGQIVIDKNLSIVGEDKTTTIIKPDTDYADGWFLVNSGINFNLSKVTLDGTGHIITKAIIHQGNGVIDNNKFTEIKDSSSGHLYAGTAIAIDSTENIDVTNNEFTQIGRNGILADGNTGTVSGNTYTGKGAGDWMDYFILSEYGDNVTISNNIISNNRGVALTDGSDSSGIAVWDDPDTQATINGNTFTNNTSGVAIAVINGDSSDPTVTIGAGNIFNNGDIGIAVQSVGAFGSPTVDITDSTFSGNEKDIVIDSGMTSSNITIHNSSFSGNTSSIVNNGTGIIDAENNWWGSAVETNIQSKISGEVNYDPWYLDSGKTTLSDTINTIFDGVSSNLASQGVESNIGDVTASNFTSFSNLYFEKTISGTKMGRITFTVALDLSSEATQTFLQNLGTYMEANAGSMKFDATTEAGMKAAGAEIKMYGVDTLGYVDGTTPIIVRDDDGNILSESDTNYPILSSISYVAGDGGTITFSTNHFTQFDLPDQDQTTPDDGGNATLSDDTSQVVVTDPDQPVDITITDGTDNPTIDVSAFITDGEGDIPQITINSNNADIAIPATTVTGPSGWDGVIAAPTVTTVDLPVISGETLTTSTAIEIGFADGKLSFDKGVRILLPGQAGKRAGYSRPGTSFTEITTVCSADSQGAGDALGVDGDCKIDVSPDMIIWTKHFTKFAAYTQTTNSTSSSSSTSSGGGDGLSDGLGNKSCTDTKPASAPTLLKATGGVNSVTLTWSKASDPVSYYLITYGLSSGAQTYGNPNVGGSDQTSYTIRGLSGGSTYYFKVRAGNGCTPGDFSNEVSATPTGVFIAAPATGFEEGVLGVSTDEADKQQDEKEKEQEGTVKGAEITPTESPTEAGSFAQRYWPWIVVVILMMSGMYYFLFIKRR